MPAPAYAELHCWSNFSFLEGAAHPEELVERGVALGLAGIALTDRDGLYGAVRFTKAALAHPGFAAISGAELTLESGSQPVRSRAARPASEVPTHSPRLVLLVENAAGYANLVELISIAQMRGRKRDARLRLDDLRGRTDGLIARSSPATSAAPVRSAHICATSSPALSSSNCNSTCGPRTAHSSTRSSGSRATSASHTSRPTASRTRFPATHGSPTSSPASNTAPPSHKRARSCAPTPSSSSKRRRKWPHSSRIIRKPYGKRSRSPNVARSAWTSSAANSPATRSRRTRRARTIISAPWSTKVRRKNTAPRSTQPSQTA